METVIEQLTSVEGIIPVIALALGIAGVVLWYGLKLASKLFDYFMERKGGIKNGDLDKVMTAINECKDELMALRHNYQAMENTIEQMNANHKNTLEVFTSLAVTIGIWKKDE